MIEVRMPLVVSPYLPRQANAPAPLETDDIDRAEIGRLAIPTRPVATSPSRTITSAAVLAVATACSVLAPPACAAGLLLPPVVAASSDATSNTDTPLLSPSIPAALRPQIAATVARLPAHVQRALQQNGTRIVILSEGETPLSAGLVSPLDARSAYSNAPDLAARADAAVARVERMFAGRMAELEKATRAVPEIESEEGLLARESARLDLDEAKSDRDALSRRAAHEATEGLVEPARSLDEVTTLRQLAADHGAQTAEQIEEFVSITVRLNAARLPAVAASPDLPVQVRAVKLLVPAYRWFTPAEGQAPIPLREHDAASILPWSDGAVAGQYFYLGTRAVVVHAGAFGVPEGTRPVGPHGSPEVGRHVLLHELGHAYEDAIRRQSPEAYTRFREQRDQAWLRIPATHDHPFAHQHEASSPAEMTAESFAATFDGGAQALRRADPRWVQALERIGVR